MPADRPKARALRTTIARWSGRAPAAFAGRAKAVDSAVTDAAIPLTKKLTTIRDRFGSEVFGPTSKAGDVAQLSVIEYSTIATAIAKIDAQLYVDAIFDDASALLEASYADVREMLAIETGFEVVPTWAIDELKKNIDEIANLAAARDRQTLSSVLDEALAAGRSAKDTASAMRVAFEEGVTVYNEGGAAVRTTPAASWFSTVARTELQRASNLGQYALYEAAGIEKVRWQAAEPCDECADADDQVLPLGEDFPGVDVDMPPAHPNCRCVLIPADDDLGDFGGTAEDRANARRGNQSASDNEE